MNIYFTSDLHFGHRYILSACNRPYATLLEMERDLIERWNSRVKGCDKVYILGDMFYRTDNIIPILEALKGKKYLIEGNHDESWLQQGSAERAPSNTSRKSRLWHPFRMG